MMIDTMDFSPEESKRFQEELISIGDVSPEFFKENLSKLLSWNSGIIKGIKKNFLGSISGKKMGFFGTPDPDAIFKGRTYADLMDLRIRIVPGQSLRFSETVNEMSALSEYLRDIKENTLDPYRGFIAHLLKYPSDLNTISPEIPSVLLVDRKSPALKNASETMASLFSGHDAITERSYGEMFRSNKEYTESATQLTAITQPIDKIDTRSIVKEVKEISDLSDLIVKRCKDNKDYKYVISDEMANALHDMTLHVAKKIELYGMFRYRLDLLVMAFKEIEKKLK